MIEKQKKSERLLIPLSGPPLVGKSTLARALSERTGIRSIDVDEVRSEIMPETTGVLHTIDQEKEIPDFDDNDAWFGYIIKKSPGIDVVFSRNALVKSIFGGRGITVISPPWHRRNTLSATRIRKLIRLEKKWQNRVPKGAVKAITANMASEL